MAPKQTEKIDNPPIASSSEEEEEEEESGSSGSESSDDEADVQSKLTQTTVASGPAKKPESDSEEVKSESDSDSEPPTKTKLLNTVVTKRETSGSAAKPPESSTTKRSLKQADDESESKKKMKTSNTDHAKKTPSSTTDEDVKKISGEEAKKMFQRLFSETDEIAMLQGYLDFTSTRGDPSENMDAFCDYVKTLIDFNATKAQIVTKLQRCKKKFVNIVKNSLKKGKSEDEIRCVKDLDHKAFELSRKIWGINGVLPAKPRTKSKKKTKLVSSTLHKPKKEGEEEETDEPMSNDVYTHLSLSREIGLFFKGETGVYGLDESRIALGWDMVEDGPKKRDIEEKLKKLKAKQMELCLQKMSLAESTAKLIFKDNASSSL